MDPLAIQGAASTGWTRANPHTSAELHNALQRGRVFAGDVLQTMSGGTVLIGVGPLRVPARAQTQLEPGRRYWFEVVTSGSPLELRVTTAPQAPPPELLRALRALLGAEAPIGTLLEDLARLLARPPGGATEAGASPHLGLPPQWEQALEQHAWRPEQGESALRSKLERSGLAFEGRLAESALDAAPHAEVERMGRELLEAWAAQIRPLLGGDASAESLLGKLAQALAQVLASSNSSSLAPAGAELDPARQLAQALARLAAPEARALASALDALDWPRWPTWMRRLLLRTLAPGSTPHRSSAGMLADVLQADLKAQLLAAHEQLDDGALRQAVERALKGIEAEQLLNLARAEVDESAQWSVPLYDGERWSTFHLSLVRDGGRGASSDEPRPRRVALEVEFSSTGAIHVDLLRSEHALTARVLARDPHVVELLSQRAPELEQLLAADGATAHATVARASDERVLHSDAPSRSSFFDSRHVMDLEG